MERPTSLRRILPFCLVGSCLALSLSACGSTVTTPEEVDTAARDPEGAALPLSIGGRVEAEGDDAMMVAVNCAAALDLTAERLASMTTNPLSNEIAMIGRAESFFIARAERAASADTANTTSAAAAIGRRRSEKADEVTEQAQLAIACLRRFGESVEAQTGA